MLLLEPGEEGPRQGDMGKTYATHLPMQWEPIGGTRKMAS
jgi:hypothetical protein